MRTPRNYLTDAGLLIQVDQDLLLSMPSIDAMAGALADMLAIWHAVAVEEQENAENGGMDLNELPDLCDAPADAIDRSAIA